MERLKTLASKVSAICFFCVALDGNWPAFISAINRYAEQRAPWKLAKSEDPEDRKRFETSLYVMAESLRLAVGLLEPVMPNTTDKVYDLLGYTKEADWDRRLMRGDTLVGQEIGEKTILFPKPQMES